MSQSDLDKLIRAMRRGQLNLVKQLTQDLPTINMQVEGSTLLYIAVFKQHTEIVEYLMSAGADPTWRNEDGLETPLMLAKKRNDIPMIRTLMTPRNKIVSVSIDFLDQLASPSTKVDPLLLEDSRCSVCYDDSATMIYLERCGHGCCIDCLEGYMKTQLDQYTAVPTIQCFAKSCSETISHSDVFKVLSSDSEHCNKFQTRLLNAVLSKMPDFAWCTHCDAGGILPPLDSTSSASELICTSVECFSCSRSFCSLCREDAHPIETCYDRYKKMMASDLVTTEKLTQKTIKSISKGCPSCLVPTERSSGCSHMICPQCTYQWCWICCGPYQPGRYTFGGKCSCAKVDS